tara:strand:+ start:25 stop:396 length:372 start_codon:yes stop_codon:yes gene_type:complete
MTNTPKSWKDMTDIEKGTLLLAEHDGNEIQRHYYDGWVGLGHDGVRWGRSVAYRIKPKAPKVETFEAHIQVFRWFDGFIDFIRNPEPEDEERKIANITHTYIITDGIVTSCDTIIHKNGEADK